MKNNANSVKLNGKTYIILKNVDVMMTNESDNDDDDDGDDDDGDDDDGDDDDGDDDDGDDDDEFFLTCTRYKISADRIFTALIIRGTS